MGGRRPALLLAVLLAVGGCGRLVAPSPSPADSQQIPESLRSLAVTTVTLDGRTLTVAVADTPEARRRGLMAIADLGPLDGLLFAYPEPVETAFHMVGVPIPLDVAFFDADGRALTILAMAVCGGGPCRTYRAPGPFRWAVETEAGALAGVVPGAMLRLEP